MTAVKFNMVSNQLIYTEKLNGSHILCTYVHAECEADCVFYFLLTAKEAAAAAARGINSLSLKWCRVFEQRRFHVFMDWLDIYLTIFKGRAMKSIWHYCNIFGNGWGNTSGEGLCIFWHEKMALTPSNPYKLVHDINDGILIIVQFQLC